MLETGKAATDTTLASDCHILGIDGRCNTRSVNGIVAITAS